MSPISGTHQANISASCLTPFWHVRLSFSFSCVLSYSHFFKGNALSLSSGFKHPLVKPLCFFTLFLLLSLLCLLSQEPIGFLQSLPKWIHFSVSRPVPIFSTLWATSLSGWYGNHSNAAWWGLIFFFLFQLFGAGKNVLTQQNRKTHSDSVNGECNGLRDPNSTDRTLALKY